MRRTQNMYPPDGHELMILYLVLSRANQREANRWLADRVIQAARSVQHLHDALGPLIDRIVEVRATGDQKAYSVIPEVHEALKALYPSDVGWPPYIGPVWYAAADVNAFNTAEGESRAVLCLQKLLLPQGIGEPTITAMADAEALANYERSRICLEIAAYLHSFNKDSHV